MLCPALFFFSLSLSLSLSLFFFFNNSPAYIFCMTCHVLSYKVSVIWKKKFFIVKALHLKSLKWCASCYLQHPVKQIQTNNLKLTEIDYCAVECLGKSGIDKQTPLTSIRVSAILQNLPVHTLFATVVFAPVLLPVRFSCILNKLTIEADFFSENKH